MPQRMIAPLISLKLICSQEHKEWLAKFIKRKFSIELKFKEYLMFLHIKKSLNRLVNRLLICFLLKEDKINKNKTLKMKIT